MAQPLTEYERDTIDTIDTIERERFRVDDDSKATWAMRKLRAVETKIQENKRIAEDERARIDEWLEISNKSLEDDADYFRSLLIDYARRERETDNRKSISTPYGAVKSRAGQPKWEINADEFLAWAKEHAPDCIRIKEEPSLSEVKARFVAPTPEGRTSIPNENVAINPDTGEVVPGIRVTPAQTSYTVEVDL